MQLGRTDNYVLDFFMGIPAIWQGFLIIYSSNKGEKGRYRMKQQ